MRSHEFNDIVVSYNERFGGMILFFINKLSLLYSKDLVEEYIDFWVEIIAELCLGTLYQTQTRYPLK